MQFVGSAVKRVPVTDIGVAPTFSLTLYSSPPSGEITLRQFEEWAQDRIRVLKVIDSARASGIKGQDLMKLIANVDDQYGLRKDARKDNCSHHILKMAYCRTEDLRRWFLAQEVHLFRSRFEREDISSKKKFLSQMNCEPVDPKELDNFRNELSVLSENEPNTSWYTVPFEEVFDLVATRRVFLHLGTAYVRESDFVSVIAGRFRQILSRSLTLCSRKLGHIEAAEADRLAPLLKNLTNAYLGPDYSNGGVHGEITLDQIDALARDSFPLCMKNCFKGLKDTHHLKHGGRLQFGLFLKGIGLSLENALAFWRQEFSQGVGVDKFEKNYSYNIRHNYGQEGKRVSYTPYSCQKIIQSVPGAGECHGCPFRMWDQDHLSAALQSMKIEHTKVRAIAEKAKDGHYQIACLRYFEATHPGSEKDALTLSIVHPNSYFDASVAYWKAKKQDSSNSNSNAAASSSSYSSNKGTKPDVQMKDQQ